MKPLHLGLAGIISGLLLGLSYLPWSPILTAFFAILPLLYLLPKIKALPMMAAALLANLIAFGIGDWALWSKLGAMTGTGIWFLQAAIMTLPWALGHLIYHRHNPKLGYVALVTTWLMLEWAMGQWLGPWSGIQLGMAPIWMPALVQWYAILGVTGGTMWLLVVNIQIGLYFWPSETINQKGTLYSALTILFLPILISTGMWMMNPSETVDESSSMIGVFAPSPEFHQPQDLSYKAIILTNTDGKGQGYFKKTYATTDILAAKGQSSQAFSYEVGTDTLEKAVRKLPGSTFEAFSTTYSRITDIMGISDRHWQMSDWSVGKTGMLNNATLLRAEAVRIYAKQGCQLICAFSPTAPTTEWTQARQQAHAIARALELRRHILWTTSDGQLMDVSRSGSYEISTVDNSVASISVSKAANSFFSNYGDLSGRLSIFVSIWLALATIVKPFRKKG